MSDWYLRITQEKEKELLKLILERRKIASRYHPIFRVGIELLSICSLHTRLLRASVKGTGGVIVDNGGNGVRGTLTDGIAFFLILSTVAVETWMEAFFFRFS